MDFSETWHKCSSCEWALSKLKGQGYREAWSTFPAKDYLSTYDRTSVVCSMEAYRSTVWHWGHLLFNKFVW